MGWLLGERDGWRRHRVSVARWGVYVGDGMGVAVGVGDDCGIELTVMVTVTVLGVAVTPAGVTMWTVKLCVPVSPLSEIVSVGMESSVLSRSWGPLRTTVAGLTLSAAR